MGSGWLSWRRIQIECPLRTPIRRWRGLSSQLSSQMYWKSLKKIKTRTTVVSSVAAVPLLAPFDCHPVGICCCRWLFSPNKLEPNVISTEAAHAFVSSAGERPLYFALAAVCPWSVLRLACRLLKTCQPPNSPNPAPIQRNPLAYEFHLNRYTGYRARRKPRQTAGAFSFRI